jgi:hypothetical protein
MAPGAAAASRGGGARTKQRGETVNNTIGLKMFSILRVYQMTEAELAEEIESDRDLVRQGFMSESEFDERAGTRALARRIRLDDIFTTLSTTIE